MTAEKTDDLIPDFAHFQEDSKGTLSDGIDPAISRTLDPVHVERELSHSPDVHIHRPGRRNVG